MRILSIHLKNIKSHKELSLDFVGGINVLAGANGVGKSTVFEAVGYALFGVDAREFVGNTERFITIGAKKGEVEVVFVAEDGQRYAVSRTVGPGCKWLLKREMGGGFEVEEHSGAGETEARLKELLGLDNGRPLSEQFTLVIGPFQHEFLGPFVIRQPTRRQDAFDEILGIDAWRKAFKGTATLVSTVTGKIEVLDVEITGKRESIAILPEKELELAQVAARQKEMGKEAAARKDELSAAEKSLAVFDDLHKAAERVKSEVRILRNRLADGKSKIVSQKKEVDEAREAVRLMEQNRSGKEACEAAEVEIARARKREKEMRAIEREANTLENESLALAGKYEHEAREVAKAARRLADEEAALNKQLAAMAPPDKLRKCASALERLRKEVDTIRAEAGLLEGRKRGLDEGREKLGEGVCPFFGEECRNLGSRAADELFRERLLR